MGTLTNSKSIGERVSEIRVHYGPGYRLYYTVWRQSVIVLLCGGDKGSQQEDIRRAARLAKEWHDA